MGKLAKAGLSIITATALALGLGGIANATPNGSSPQNVPTSNLTKTEQHPSCSASNGKEPLKSSEVTDQGRVLAAKNAVSSAIDKGSISPVSPQTYLDMSSAIIVDISRGTASNIVVTIPLKSEDYALLSNLTVMFDTNLNLLTYSETVISESNSHTFMVDTYTDGTANKSVDTGKPYVSKAQQQADIDNVRQQLSNPMTPRGFGEKALCVGGLLGIDAAAATALVMACAGSCGAAVTGVGAVVLRHMRGRGSHCCWGKPRCANALHVTLDTERKDRQWLTKHSVKGYGTSTWLLSQSWAWYSA